MMAVVSRNHSREFKLEAVQRLLGGKTSLGELSRELGVVRSNLIRWRKKYLAGGAEALWLRGQYPRGAATGALRSGAPPGERRSPPSDLIAVVAELQRKIGEQQLDLDFFERALREVKEGRQRSEASGAATSTPSSRR